MKERQSPSIPATRKRMRVALPACGFLVSSSAGKVISAYYFNRRPHGDKRRCMDYIKWRPQGEPRCLDRRLNRHNCGGFCRSQPTRQVRVAA